MDAKDMSKKSTAELTEHLAELRKEQFGLRMQKGTGQLTKPHELKRVRREIARTKTVLGAAK